MTFKDIRIKSSEELESQIVILKDYYGVKSKAGAIRKAIRDTSMVAKTLDLKKSGLYCSDEGWKELK